MGPPGKALHVSLWTDFKTVSYPGCGRSRTGPTRGSSEWTDLVEGKDLSSSSPQDLTTPGTELVRTDIY